MSDKECETQTQSQTSELEINGNSQSQTICPIWGRLYAKKKGFQNLDLYQEHFSIGRADSATFVLSEENLPDAVFCRISKIHFRITRDNCELSNPVFIKDLSKNGTFINSERIGFNKRRILQNNDKIAVAHPQYTVLIYQDLSNNENCKYPDDIVENYHVSKTLGSGACGTVSLVYDRRTCQRYAMKHVRKNMLASKKTVNDPNKVMNEANIMTALNHPCVVKLHEFIDKPDSIYMVLEYMEGGDLLTMILKRKRLSEKISKFFFYQLCSAVKYLHDKGVTHRDLKPDNILLSSSREYALLKISDFGLSKLVENNTIMQTVCGTLLYVAPEIIERGQKVYSEKVDIWSLGVVLFTCLSGTLPFSDDLGTPAAEQIRRGKFCFSHPCWQMVSSRAKELIKKMLTVRPEHRPSIDDVLRNKWLNDEEIIEKAKAVMTEGIIADNDDLDDIPPPNKRIRQ